MKKYISLLSLVAVFVMESCERFASDINIGEQGNQNMKALSYKKSVKAENKSASEINDTNSTNNLGNDSKDKPKRDKQHWRYNPVT